MDQTNETKILVVDDEARIRRLLKMYLERENYVIEEAENGDEAIAKGLETNYDLILLDLMMPGTDGIEVCRQIREKKATPIIMLTAKGEEANRVQGFESGTDDYIVKPFSPREVVLRVKALLRRASQNSYFNANTPTKNVLVFSHLSIDHDAHRVTADGTEVSLTPKEYELLYFLAKTPDKVYDREKLLKEVWQYEFFGDLRTVDTHVKRLREKLNKVSPGAAKKIVTVWGVGYKFEVGAE
ncbi:MULTISPECIES: DNA-binding response regulator ResD [Bacillus]|jgi:two-component system response regulator ResD|uniref:DNA-binding response regulator ResD n=2 Tax=Bacillus mojavensis subgroup TaxID=653388 RepID=A0AAP3CR61_BACMO|nr:MULTISPECIES: DNA-binding response regulator ResD [Bacillus]MBV7317854.1 DNA-binding response regulator ResD [Halalkalibacterium halodurans]KUP30096.1 two-component system response regulator [Bacillus halotolerans]KUP30613.1 two-component system response regulator [Bacillus halotolerans]KUP42079.1 two-component system response regulator [Bacillus halotolerans]MBJ7571177.1 DNA-binding response regulator ResD [Bacillus halotolerans]